MKKILFKKTSKVYRIITFAMILTILISSIPSVAITNSTGNLRRIQLSSGKTVTLTEQQFADIIEITQEEAIIIANGFICDMIAAGIVEWNEQTEVISVVPMYDNSNTDTVTAYTINLTQGYIVVSAFRDTYNLIPEWSDKSEPLYESIEHSDNQKIIYLGLYEYYIDTDIDNAIGLGNVTVNKSQIVDNITPNRSLDCIPDSVFEVASKTESNVTRGNTISDPEADANNYTTGPFVVRQTVDYWSSYMPYYTYRYGEIAKGYTDCCGPVAFTNLVGAYKARYSWAGNSFLRGFTAYNDLFVDIATYGINNGYYVPKSLYPNEEDTGTIDRFNYIPGLLNRYAMWSNYYIYSSGDGIGSYDALYAHLQDNRLIDLALPKTHAIYGNGQIGHEVICHGVTRFQSTSTNAYLSYAHIADGSGVSIRYITVASMLTVESVSVEFLGV